MTTSFMDLPPELRLDVYDLTIVPPSVMQIYAQSIDPEPPHARAVWADHPQVKGQEALTTIANTMCVSKAVCSDATSHFCRNMAFRICLYAPKIPHLDGEISAVSQHHVLRLSGT